MERVRYQYPSLEDFLTSKPLTVDGELDDGWGAYFAVKGIETCAAILFADIAQFSRRTRDLTPTETLVFVNNFFAWITAEALRDKPCIVDKYIGDEVMVVFSEDFGSTDPVRDALEAARWIAQHDALSFCLHMGIGYGPVTIGFVGTPIKYNCSVFGYPVTLASRCASVAPQARGTSSIMLPAELWKDRALDEIFPLEIDRYPNGSVQERPLGWEEFPPRKVELKNLGELEIVEIGKTGFHLPQLSADDRARLGLERLREAGRYWPQRTKPLE